MALYGYARVSVREPEDKNLDLQVERLVRAGGRWSAPAMPLGNDRMAGWPRAGYGTAHHAGLRPPDALAGG